MIILWKLMIPSSSSRLHYGLQKLYPNLQATSSLRRMCLTRYKIPTQIHHTKVEKLRQIDNVPRSYELVYKSRLLRYMKVGYHLSYILTAVGLFGLIYHMRNDKNLKFPALNGNEQLEYRSSRERLYVHAGITLMNIVIFMFCRIHAARIWYNPKLGKYILVVINGLPKKYMKKIEFNQNEFREKFPHHPSWIMHSFHCVKGKMYHIYETNFSSPVEYHKLVGRYGAL